MEALACGTPSVCANTGGPPDYIPQEAINKGMALLVPPIVLEGNGQPLGKDRKKYIQHLAEGINKVFEQGFTVEQRNWLSGAMRHLTWSHQVQRLGEIYTKLHAEVIG